MITPSCRWKVQFTCGRSLSRDNITYECVSQDSHQVTATFILVQFRRMYQLIKLAFPAKSHKYGCHSHFGFQTHRVSKCTYCGTVFFKYIIITGFGTIIQNKNVCFAQSPSGERNILRPFTLN